jgi:nicotinate-nucleotide--dimethylbenzimidazole phosphoribosyltransferase
MTFDIPQIATLDRSFESTLAAAINNKTKPLGSLGRLEEIALQFGLIFGTVNPEIKSPRMLVFAGNHGATNEGISAYPAAVTEQMILNFLSGGAAINAFCNAFNIDLEIVNVGVHMHDAPEAPNFLNTPIAAATRNYALEPAMSIDEVSQALEIGSERVRSAIATGSNLILLGEMGIGNSASAALLTSSFTGRDIGDCVGRGTGLDDAGLKHKVKVLDAAMRKHGIAQSALEVLRTYGGFEIAAMAGAILTAAREGAAVVIDGYIATSAALAAVKLAPNCRDYLIFSHRSQEPGHTYALSVLGAKELLNLDLRLGEGSGAALAYPLLVAACEFMNKMATFESAAVDTAL